MIKFETAYYMHGNTDPEERKKPKKTTTPRTVLYQDLVY